MLPPSNCSSGLIESHFRSQLNPNEAFRIIEAGIKFFLFQRGQIPLPYEKLHEPTKSGKGLDEPHNQCRLVPSKLPGILVDMGNPRGSEDWEENLESAEGWSRLRLMKNQMRAKRQEIRMTMKLNRLLQKEMLAREMWDDIFLKLRAVFLPTRSVDVTAIVVMFGPSIYNPKETITFRIDPSLTLNNFQNNEGVTHFSESFPAMLRDFHKKIIMSPEFLDFTTKPLRSTGSHVCVLTTRMIEDQNLRENFILIENFPKILLQREAPDKSADTQPLLAVVKRNKYLEVSLQLLKQQNDLSNQQPITVSCNEVFVENTKTGGSNTQFLTAAVECTANKGSINMFCYHLPIRYRGFSVAKK